MATTTKTKTARVGLLVSVALAILMIFLFFIGSEQKIFARKNEYTVRLESASGLAEGNPVRMSGVTIGVVRDIRLPRDPKERQVEITLMVDRKYAERIRGDSRVRLKKLGLLTGDSYIDVTPGTPRFAVLESGSVIPSQRQTDVESLITSGEDLVDNFVQISYSLKNILQRIDRGEGLIGELTTAPETKQRITDTFLTTLNKTNAALKHIESGRGVVGRLLYDDAYAENLTVSIGGAARSMQAITLRLQASLESGEGAIPALLTDPEGKRRVYEIVENLRATSSSLSTFTTSLQTGEGLVPRLMSDRAYADEALGEFSTLVRQLNEIVGKINRGEGTAGRIITDPSLYESVNDILIGINESKLLRWLIRNRQQSGINRRVDELRKSGAASEPAPALEPTVDVEPVIVAPTTTAPVVIVPPPAAPATTTEPPPVTVPTDTQATSTQPPPTSTQPE